MPRNADDIETYLLQLNRTFERKDGMFLVAIADGPPVAVMVEDPIVVARVDIGKAPKDETRQLGLFRQLLEYNGTQLVHAAYALEGNEVVLVAGIPVENIDVNEIAAVLSDMELAIARHVSRLRELAME